MLAWSLEEEKVSKRCQIRSKCDGWRRPGVNEHQATTLTSLLQAPALTFQAPKENDAIIHSSEASQFGIASNHLKCETNENTKPAGALRSDLQPQPPLQVIVHSPGAFSHDGGWHLVSHHPAQRRSPESMPTTRLFKTLLLVRCCVRESGYAYASPKCMLSRITSSARRVQPASLRCSTSTRQNNGRQRIKYPAHRRY